LLVIASHRKFNPDNEMEQSMSVRDEQIPPLRVPASVRLELEEAAAERRRTLSDMARLVLTDFVEKRIAERSAA
jgi:hypothetical protein